MRTAVKRTKVYKFDELPKDAQQRAIQKHSDINVYEGWWEGEVDYYITEIWSKLGLKADCSKVCFSIDREQYLYFPQNTLYVEDIKLFCKTIKPLVSKTVLKGIKDGSLIVSFPVAYHGGGNGTQVVDIENYDAFIPDAEVEQAETAIKEWLNIKQLRELWKALFKDYDNSMTDEAIAETLRINDYEFTKEGDIY